MTYVPADWLLSQREPELASLQCNSLVRVLNNILHKSHTIFLVWVLNYILHNNPHNINNINSNVRVQYLTQYPTQYHKTPSSGSCTTSYTITHTISTQLPRWGPVSVIFFKPSPFKIYFSRRSSAATKLDRTNLCPLQHVVNDGVHLGNQSVQPYLHETVLNFQTPR